MQCPVCHKTIEQGASVHEIKAYGESYITCSSKECAEAFVVFLKGHAAHLYPSHYTKQ